MLLHFSPAEGFLLNAIMLALAVLWDAVLGEPRWLHPVVGIGKLIAAADRLAPRQGKVAPLLYGIAMAVLIPGGLAVAAYFLIAFMYNISPIACILIGAFLLKSTFAVRELEQVAMRVCRCLEKQDSDGARFALRSLVRRDSTVFGPGLMASAAVESVAESTADSFAAPWLAFAFFGLPGAIAYRAINTLDSMVGYHGEYEYLGKASARLDDLANLVPARLASLFIVAASPLARLSPRLAWATAWQQHNRTESPNAGWTMSAMAGALGVELEKPGSYRLGRPLRPVEAGHIKTAVYIMHWVAAATFLLALAILAVRYGLSQA